MDFNELSFIEFSKRISNELYASIKKYYEYKLIYGNAKIEYECDKLNDSKQEHKIDKYAKNIIYRIIENEYSFLLQKANIFMEDLSGDKKKDSICTIYIDPVDGSRSADQHIGDPCVMLAYSDKSYKDVKFKDLKSCFVKGLHSGDVYFTYKNKAYYVPGGYSFEIIDEKVVVNNDIVLNQIKNKDLGVKLKDASVIVRDGYGMRSVVQNKIDHNVLNLVKHTFSYDITGLELCYLASCRGIVHLMVEARKHYKNNKYIGSDGFNLIPYPLIKAVGGDVYDIEGRNLREQLFDPYMVYDFVATVDQELFKEFYKAAIEPKINGVINQII